MTRELRMAGQALYAALWGPLSELLKQLSALVEL